MLAAKTLRFCYDRLSSLLKTLEISAVDDFTPIHLVADFATLLGTYQQGFAVRHRVKRLYSSPAACMSSVQLGFNPMRCAPFVSTAHCSSGMQSVLPS